MSSLRRAFAAIARRSASEHLILAAAVLASGLTSAWNIGYAGYSTFYSTTARSMTVSWRAFAFGTFDPSASITLDKLSGFLIPQALSARLFGFHPWSIALPQVIEGMVTVVAAFVIARRWKGRAAAILAAMAVATTPLLPSMFGHEMEDGLLTMSLALALLCWQSAILRGRLSSLLLCAFWVAVGFQAKMMQAWLIVPGLAVGYLVAAPQPLRGRLGRGSLAAVVLFGLSVGPMTILQLIPAAHRPYIDGSTNNNAYSMVFGYNGFNRLVPNLVPGAIGNTRAVPRAPAVVSPGPRSAISPLPQPRPRPLPPGRQWSKLVLPYYTTQVGWLYPAALTGLLLPVGTQIGRWRRRKTRPADAAGSADAHERRVSTATVLALGSWLLLCAGVLTAASVPHVAYFAAISVQIGLLASAALVDAIRLYHREEQRGQAVLPVLVLAETLWTALILGLDRSGPSFLLPLISILGLGTSMALVRPGRLRTGTRWHRGLLTAALLAVFIAPTAWTSYALDPARNGSAGEAYTGPRPSTAAAAISGRLVSRHRYRIAVPFRSPGDPQLSAAQVRLVDYLRRRVGAGDPLMITDQWPTASPYILDGGLDVQTMGGFSGLTPTPTLLQLRRLIGTGRLRFVLLTDRKPLTVFNHTVQQDRAWLRNHCVPVQPAQYGGSGLLGQRLYACGADANIAAGPPPR